MRPPGTPRQLHKRREYAISLLKSGKSAATVANAVGASRSSVLRWQRAYKKHGTKGLRPKPILGRPRGLTNVQQKLLIKILSKGPLAAGYKTELWTLKRISRQIENLFGIRYHAGSVWYILKRIGWSCQKPQKRASKRHEKAIQEWKETEWPKIHEAEKEGYTIVFIDEAAFYLLPSVARTWAPKGHTPTLHYQATRDHLSAIAAITTKGDLFLQTQETSFRSPAVVRFLIYLQDRLPSKLLIVWDNIPIHRSWVVKEHVIISTSAVRLKYFPSYASELNPVEGVWHFLKNVILKNLCSADLKSLRYEMKLAERKLRRKRGFVIACLKEVGYYL